jgi:hypothetical protein
VSQGKQLSTLSTLKSTLQEGCLSALFAGATLKVVEENIREEYIRAPDEIEDSSNQVKNDELVEDL